MTDVNTYRNDARWAACNTWLDEKDGNLSMEGATKIADAVYENILQNVLHTLTKTRPTELRCEHCQSTEPLAVCPSTNWTGDSCEMIEVPAIAWGTFIEVPAIAWGTFIEDEFGIQYDMTRDSI